MPPHTCNQPVLAGIEARMLNTKKSRLTVCLWDLLMAEIDILDQSIRSRFGWGPDSTFFWSFVHDEIAIVGLKHRVCTRFTFRALCERILSDEPSGGIKLAPMSAARCFR